jgi:1-phosphatidylinositol-3-phosphate 5-kinase
MNVNKNLHNTSVLTEFARNFEEDQSETVISKLVNKIYEACNNVNADIGGTSTTQQPQSPQNEDDNSETSSSASIPSSLSSSTPVDQKKEQSPTVYQVDTSQGRTSLNVIKRISNLIALRDKDLNDYKNTELKKLWMPDDKSRECYDCALKFTTFRRKHHCKFCLLTRP